MSDLQVGLLVLGLLFIAGVMSYNWWQARRWQKHAMPIVATPAPGPAPDAASDNVQQRIEPSFEGAQPAADDETLARTSVFGVDDSLDFMIEVRAGEVITPIALKALRTVLVSMPKRVQLSGFNYHAREWEPLAADPGAEYTMVRAAMQLVDRSGAVTQTQLEEFATFVKDFASGSQALAQVPDVDLEMQRAAGLDGFCSEVDVVVGINVIAPTGQFFHGSKIRSLADGMGLQLQGAGGFHCSAEDGTVLFTLDNQEHRLFLPDQIRSMTTAGLTFLLDVPRTADGLRAFDRMLTMAKSYAESLDGTLADDNRVTLSDAGLDKIRQQLRAIYASMAARGIAPGGPIALRLFS